MYGSFELYQCDTPLEHRKVLDFTLQTISLVLEQQGLEYIWA